MLIRILPIGDVSKKILEILSEELQSELNVKCRILPEIEIPENAFNQWRKQYDAEKIMDNISKIRIAKFIDKSIPTLAIIEKDIYYNGLNFIFGLEDTTGYCIISTARLNPLFYKKASNFGILIDRTVKEAIHEIGHYFGLDHCVHPFCVMCFSPSVEDVDEKRKSFCNDCKIKLATKGINIE